MKQMVIWLLILAGMPVAVVFGWATLFCLSGGPYGIIVAIGFTGPLFLVGLGSAILGTYLRERSLRTESTVPVSKTGVTP